MTVQHVALCEMTSRSTGKPCQQPERWLERYPGNLPAGVEIADMSVCQVHGRQLERQGWRFVRELHPVAGYERQAGEP